MDGAYYLSQFQLAVNKLDKTAITQKQLQLETGVWLNSVVLRMQKAHWANEPFKQPQSGSAIFYSVWTNEESITQQKLYYNIHALKLRQLKGYKITSREFASAFRNKFKPFESACPNVSTQYGPLTLMQGWIPLDLENIERDVFTLANQFMQIDYLIDDLLEKYKSGK